MTNDAMLITIYYFILERNLNLQNFCLVLAKVWHYNTIRKSATQNWRIKQGLRRTRKLWQCTIWELHLHINKLVHLADLLQLYLQISVMSFLFLYPTLYEIFFVWSSFDDISHTKLIKHVTLSVRLLYRFTMLCL